MTASRKLLVASCAVELCSVWSVLKLTPMMMTNFFAMNKKNVKTPRKNFNYLYKISIFFVFFDFLRHRRLWLRSRENIRNQKNKKKQLNN